MLCNLRLSIPVIIRKQSTIINPSVTKKLKVRKRNLKKYAELLVGLLFSYLFFLLLLMSILQLINTLK